MNSMQHDCMLYIAKICIKLQNVKPRMDLEKLYVQRQKEQDTVEEKLGAVEENSV
jgi:hypothetical protein